MSVRVDADLSEGIREIVGTLPIEVISGEAVMVLISAGSPEPVQASRLTRQMATQYAQQTDEINTVRP